MPATNSKFLSPATADPQPLEGYWVLRGYKGDDPMTTVMDLPREEMVALCEKTQPTRGKGPLRPDGTRDQRDYVDDRTATEKWARENADLPKAAAEHPIYMAITTDPDKVAKLMTRNAPPGMRLLIAPVTAEMARKSTVTDGDSMGHYYATSGYREADGSVPFLTDAQEHRGQILDVTQAAKAGIQQGELQYWGRDPLPGQKIYNAADMTPIETGVEKSRYASSFAAEPVEQPASPPSPKAKAQLIRPAL